MQGKQWFDGLEEMLDQAERQFRAAKGTPIEWHFAEREVADLVRKLLEERFLGRIKVIPTIPPPAP